MIRLLVMLTALSALPESAAAQNNLAIKNTFDIYGKWKNATSVELRGEMVSSYNMTLYKSITVEENSLALNNAQMNIETDKEQSTIIREVIKDGKITSGFYRLNEKTKDGQNRYILFKVMATNTFAIVYVEGSITVESLTKFLKLDTSF